MLTIAHAAQSGNAISLPAARHARLPLQRARVVAELAGFSVEAAYV